MLGLALDRIAEAQAAAARLARASRRAERTHLRAADIHERAAELYESLGKTAEAARERAQASRDRAGAEIERRRRTERYKVAAQYRFYVDATSTPLAASYQGATNSSVTPANSRSSCALASRV